MSMILVYFAYYFAKRDRTVYLRMTENGGLQQWQAGGVSVLGWLMLTATFILMVLFVAFIVLSLGLASLAVILLGV